MEGRPLDEQSLIDKAKGGDMATYGELVRRIGEDQWQAFLAGADGGMEIVGLDAQKLEEKYARDVAKPSAERRAQGRHHPS